MTFFQSDPQLLSIATEIVETTRQSFPALGAEQISLSWIVYETPAIVNTGGALSPEDFWQRRVRGCAYRGRAWHYPASIVKLFYLVAIQEWLETRMVDNSPELQRAIADSITVSSNDATSLIVDILSGTTSGPDLSSAPFNTWKEQRNIVNRYYQSLGWLELEGINVNQKTWCDGPYGRERAFVGEKLENRNRLSTNATARLLHAIVGGVAVSAARSQRMMELLERSLDPPPPLPPPGEENQVTGFLGEVLPQNAKLWSKAGWTSKVRHDAAYIELPTTAPFLLVVFTVGEASQNRRLLPFIAQKFVEAVSRLS